MRATEHARNTDPGTSHAAAARIEPAAAKHRARIMRTLERGPGTFEEIAERAQLLNSQVWRRLPDLEKLGFAEPTGEERLGRSGRFMRVWQVGPAWRPDKLPTEIGEELRRQLRGYP